MISLLESFLACRWRLTKMVGCIVRPDEIEDIVQETFVLSFAASRKQDIRNPQAFMMRVARNIALDHIGKLERKLNCSLDEVDDGDLISDMNTELHCQSEERFLEFCRAVSALPSSCRRVFILRKVYGLSLNEIAGHLGITSGTVEKHITKGLSLVVEHMLKSGHSERHSSLGIRRGKQR